MKSDAGLGLHPRRAAGLTGLTLDVTFSIAESKANTIQCVQAWWGSGSTLGQKVGQTGVKIGEKTTTRTTSTSDSAEPPREPRVIG